MGDRADLKVTTMEVVVMTVNRKVKSAWARAVRAEKTAARDRRVARECSAGVWADAFAHVGRVDNKKQRKVS